MDVDFGNLELAQQVLERQQGHVQAMKQHLEQHARLDSGDMGLILQLLVPVNDAILAVGEGALDLSAQTFGAAADNMAATVALYRNADQQAYDAVAAVGSMLGMTIAPYSQTPTPTLGAAQQSAGPHYGDADGNVVNQAFWDGFQAAAWIDSTAQQAVDRAGKAFSGAPTVTEAVDVRSYLPTPATEDPELEEIRWKAGIILGGVDWLYEQLFGYSLLEEITKPFAGNWTRMSEAAIAWNHVSDGLTGVAQNTSALGPALADWTGKGSETFLVAAGAVAAAHQAASGPAGTVASMLKALIFLSKQIAGQILKLLKRIQNRLLRMAVEAAVPVAGWVVAAAETLLMIQEIVDDVLTAYKWVNLIYDFVASMVKGQTALVDVRFMLVDLAESLVRAGAARAT